MQGLSYLASHWAYKIFIPNFFFSGFSGLEVCKFIQFVRHLFVVSCDLASLYIPVLTVRFDCGKFYRLDLTKVCNEHR